MKCFKKQGRFLKETKVLKIDMLGKDFQNKERAMELFKPFISIWTSAK